MTYITNQDERVLALVEANVGLAMIPEHYTSSHIKTLPLAENQSKRVIGLEWGESDNLSEVIKFADFSCTAS